MGGPAGTMEGGRQADVAKAILSSKNVPYVVAAPLLIQVRSLGLGFLVRARLRVSHYSWDFVGTPHIHYGGTKPDPANLLWGGGQVGCAAYACCTCPLYCNTVPSYSTARLY